MTSIFSRLLLGPCRRGAIGRSGPCTSLLVQLGLRVFVVLLLLCRWLAAQSLFVVAQRDDGQEVCIAQCLGPLLQPLAATIGVPQLLRDRLFGLLGFLLLLLQRRNLVQQMLTWICYCGAAGSGGWLSTGASDSRRRLDARLGAGSRRPTGRRLWGKSCGGHWVELAAVALVLGGSRGGGKGGGEFGSRGVHGCAGAELEEATDWP